MEGEVILVAVDASKELTTYALEWAAHNVTRALDCLILLALVPSHSYCHPNSNIRTKRSRTSQFFSCLLKKLGIGRRGSRHKLLINRVDHDMLRRANNVCLNMMQELCSTHDLMQVRTKVKVVDMQPGSLASKAKELQASWVILDRHLKNESKHCLKQLKCNIVLVDHTVPKILKAVSLPLDKNLNRRGYQNNKTETRMLGSCPRYVSRDYVCTATTRSNLEIVSPIFEPDVPFSLPNPSNRNVIPHKEYDNMRTFNFNKKAQVTVHESDSQLSHESSNLIIGKSHPKMSAKPLYDKSHYKESSKTSLPRAITGMKEEAYGTIRQKVSIRPRRQADTPHSRPNNESSLFSKDSIPNADPPTISGSETPFEVSSSTMNRTSSVRKALSLYSKQPPNPPPLCSICKHNAPIFGKAPKKFSFKEIEIATNKFSRENFLAEGGFGPVHKGLLPDGQVVAVKQHKMSSARGASEFCSEVEALSCAQHRNLVMLVGYCIEREWLLVYEFSCNGSLDMHLYGTEKKELISWKSRMKIAIGAARGLRYLHEDCRVGCIVHRDFRPNNILLTHDFEPMVGDFGLARWQVDGQSAEETRVIGSLGYLAPEYTLSGLITEKADVYAFGVVLLELLTGFNVTEFSRKTGQQFVPEWGSPLLESMNMNKIIDPLLENNYAKKEVECMMVAARLCISPNPDQRPRMSKVLKILEGDVLTSVACDYRKRSSCRSSQDTSFNHSSNMIELKKTSACGVNEVKNTIEPVSLSKQNELLSEVNACEEYQAYLHVSLAKFVQNLSKN